LDDPPAVQAPLLLVADDDALSRRVVVDGLIADGFRVVEAVDGTEALELFGAQQPDLLVLDVVMPGLDGFAVCAEVRRTPAGATIPIMMLTSLEDTGALSQAFEAGATDFATKPINAALLAHRVRYMLRATETLDALRRSEARLEAAQAIARVGHWEWDSTSDELLCSTEARRVLELPQDGDRISMDAFRERLHPLDRTRVLEAFGSARQEGEIVRLDHRIVLSDGVVHTVHLEATLLSARNGSGIRLMGTVQDVTDRAEAEARIRSLAYYDSLTGLPNRVMFGDLLRAALARGTRKKHHVAAMFLDLDNFKRINDTMGHSAGDKLLAEVAQRLRRAVREHDPLGRGIDDEAKVAVARLGGDEFLLALTDLDRPDDAGRVAKRILESMKAPCQIGTAELYISASIGISVFPQDGIDVDDLLKNADTALYHAKELGRNTYSFYDETMNRMALERLLMEGQLRRAIEEDQFVLHYQPLVDVATDRIIGTEALLRWQHPDHGLLAPAHFIDVLEQTGLMHTVGDWVVRTACSQLQAWREAGLPDTRVTVNLSALQFRQPKLLQTLLDAAEAASIDPPALELEITERVLLDGGPDGIKMLEALRSHGFRIALDDFGTGYSSLSYLRRFPVDRLKIDRSFIRDATLSDDDAAIVVTILDLARALGIDPIAEGVELEEQREFLRARGCVQMQGNLFGRPVPPDELGERLASGGALPQDTPVEPSRHTSL
jgi:diguanylate cyclase (GGDEF)-like protein/PAS domain S-box-containing protein